MPDLGIWSKLNIYSNSDLCFSVKYDAGLNNLETGGNLYFMFGIKAKGIERLTISIFTSPAKQYELKNVITGSGLFLSVHNVPILHRTVMIGSNFFFSQNFKISSF
jgi:acetyltransferase-like isoleucine patch superfamily enzyme